MKNFFIYLCTKIIPLIIAFVIITTNYYAQCINGTPPTLNCGAANTTDQNDTYTCVSNNNCLPDPSCGPGVGESDWYSFTYTGNDAFQISDTWIGALQNFAIYTADGCNELGCSLSRTQDMASDGQVEEMATIDLTGLGLVPGTTYLLRVFNSGVNVTGGFGQTPGAGGGQGYTIDCTNNQQPVTNNCEDAILLSDGDNLTATNQFATIDDGLQTPSCVGTLENPVWYQFCSTTAGDPVDVNLTNISYTSDDDGSAANGFQFVIMSGNCGNWTEEFCASTNASTYTTTWTPDPCQCYYFFVDGINGDGIDFDLSFSNINNNPIDLSGVPADETCLLCDGTIDINISGGAGGYTFSWVGPNGFTSTSEDISGLCDGDYTLTATDANGCVVEYFATVGEFSGGGGSAVAGFNINNTTQCLSGNSFSFTNTGTTTSGTSYTWDFETDGTIDVSGTNNSAENPTFSYPSAGSYMVTQTVDDGSGCPATASQTVTVVATPLVTVNSPTICFGDDATLTASGASTYAWTNSGTLSSNVGSPVTSSVTSTTSYTVAGTTSGCSSSPVTATVTVLPEIIPNFTFGGTFCESSNSVNFTNTTNSGALNSPNYSWSFTSGTPSTSTATSPSGLTWTTAGTYDVTLVVNDGLCSESIVLPITINPSPTAVVSGGGTICAGDPIPDVTITLTGTGPWDFTYTDGVTPVSITGQATSPYTISGGGDGTYTVTAVNDALCTGTTSGSATITTNPSPTAVVSGGGTICSGDPIPDVTVALTGTGPWDFTYTDGVTPVSITGQATSPYTISGGGDGTYTVTTINDALCTGTTSGSATITTNPSPTAVVSGGGTICSGDPIPDVTIALTGTGPWDFTYTDGVTPVSITGQATSPYTISGGGDGTYTVTAVNDALCTGTTSGSATITTNPSPTAVVSGGGTICAGDPIPDVTIALTGTGPWDFTYTDGVTPVSITGQASSPYTISGGGDGTYTVTAVNDALCTGTTSGSATITTNPSPTAVVSGGGTICSGDPIPDVTIALTGTGPWDFTYTDGVTPFSITGQATSPYTISGGGDGTYTVTAVNDALCTGNFGGSATITTNPSPTAVVSGGGTICSGDPIPDVTIALTGTGPWDFTYTDGVTPVSITSQATSPYTISGGGDGTYTVTAVNDALCAGTTSGSATITTNPSPTAVVSGGGTICSGDPIPDVTIALTGTGPWDFTYTDGVTPVSITGQATSPYTISGGGDGTYTVTAVNDALCTGTTSGSATIVTDPLPTAVISGGGIICIGDPIPSITIALTGNAPWNFTYTDGVTPVSVTGIAASPYVIAGALDGTYTVTALSDANCTGTSLVGSATITTNSLPTAVVSGGGTICSGDPIPDVTIALTGTGPWDFTYTDGVTPVSITGQATSPYTISGGGDGTYTVTVLNDANCVGTSSGTATISTNPTPIAPTAGTDEAYCFGEPMVDLFAAGGGGTLTWYDDAGLTNVIATGTSLTPSSAVGTDIYYVTETLAGCEGPANLVTITVNENPSITLETSTDVSSCGSTDGTITVTVTGGSGVYQWQINGGGYVAGSSPFTFTGLGVNTYVVDVFDGNCFDQGTTITVSNPSVPAAPFAGLDATYCEGDAMLDMTATAVGGGNLTWYDDGALTNVAGTGPTMMPFAQNGATIYYVTETVAGCESPSTQVTITINPLPVAPVAGTSAVYCDGDPISDLTATAAIGGTLNWYDDAGLTNNVGTGAVLTPSSSVGNYTYYVTEIAAGCEGPSTSITIDINSSPTFTVVASDPTTCGGIEGSITISGLIASNAYDVTYTDDGTAIGPSLINADLSGDIEITGLNAGNYDNITVSFLGCNSIDAGVFLLSDPNAPTYSIATFDPITCGGVEGTLTISGLNLSTSYNVTYDDAGTTIGPAAIMTDGAGDIIITGLDAGVYDNFIIELAGCTTPDAGPYVLADPLAPTYTVSTTDPLSCGANDGTIILSGLTPSTNYNITYEDDGALVGPSLLISDVAGELVITGLDAGSYANIIVDLLGCSSLDIGPYTLNDPGNPTYSVSITNPTVCGGTDGSITISNLDHSYSV